MVERIARITTYSKDHYLAGITSQKGPDNSHIAIGEDQAELMKIREITSKLGFLIERSTARILSREISVDPDIKCQMAKSFSELSLQLVTPKYQRIKSNQDLSTCYRQLTEPPEIPWDGTERSIPTNESLTTLFNCVDYVFGSTFMRDFTMMGRDEEAMDFNFFRYYVEASMALARLAVDPPAAFPGIYYSNVRVQRLDGKPLTQFDAISVPYRRKQHNFNLINHIHRGLRWSDEQFKATLRTRYVSGTGKLLQPFMRDIRESLHQIAKVAILAEGKGSVFPDFISLYYIRGLQPNAVHHIRIDQAMLAGWTNVLWDNVRDGLITDEEELQEVLTFLSIMEDANNLKKVGLKFPKAKMHNFTTNGLKQQGMEGFDNLTPLTSTSSEQTDGLPATQTKKRKKLNPNGVVQIPFDNFPLKKTKKAPNI